MRYRFDLRYLYYLILREDEIIGIAGDVAGLRCDLLQQIAGCGGWSRERKFFLRDFFVSDKANIRASETKNVESLR